ncbi:MAG TPA: hypothetical protein DCQ31_13460, partial [Bacteroidales bacterium]|nr:hypothetical protein [Bacteroidales bacterium]
MENASQTNVNYEFAYIRPVKRHDLLITEILADPLPSVGLPEFEYIEIYNNLPHSVNLSAYQLKV